MRFPFHHAWMRTVIMPLCCSVLLWPHPAALRADEQSIEVLAPDVSSATNQSLSLDDVFPTRDDDRVPAATSAEDVSESHDAEQGSASSATRQALVLTRRAGSGPGSTDEPTVAPTKLMDATSIGALAIVLIVLGVVVYALRRYVPALRQADHDALRVVARTGLSPKHSLALIRLGRRYVLVSMAGDRVNSLCEVTDPEEVAELTAHVGNTTRSGNAFDNLLSHELKDYRSERRPAAKAGRRQEDVGGVREGDGAAPGFTSLRSRLRSLKAG